MTRAITKLIQININNEEMSFLKKKSPKCSNLKKNDDDNNNISGTNFSVNWVVEQLVTDFKNGVPPKVETRLEDLNKNIEFENNDEKSKNLKNLKNLTQIQNENKIHEHDSETKLTSPQSSPTIKVKTEIENENDIDLNSVKKHRKINLRIPQRNNTISGTTRTQARARARVRSQSQTRARAQTQSRSRTRVFTRTPAVEDHDIKKEADIDMKNAKDDRDRDNDENKIRKNKESQHLQMQNDNNNPINIPNDNHGIFNSQNYFHENFPDFTNKLEMQMDLNLGPYNSGAAIATAAMNGNLSMSDFESSDIPSPVSMNSPYSDNEYTRTPNFSTHHHNLSMNSINGHMHAGGYAPPSSLPPETSPLMINNQNISNDDGIKGFIHTNRITTQSSLFSPRKNNRSSSKNRLTPRSRATTTNNSLRLSQYSSTSSPNLKSLPLQIHPQLTTETINTNSNYQTLMSPSYNNISVPMSPHSTFELNCDSPLLTTTAPPGLFEIKGGSNSFIETSQILKDNNFDPSYNNIDLDESWINAINQTQHLDDRFQLLHYSSNSNQSPLIESNFIVNSDSHDTHDENTIPNIKITNQN